jgi:type IV pilus assembly protein PilC
MPLYRYTLLDQTGHTREEVEVFSSRQELLETLQQEDNFLLKYKRFWTLPWQKLSLQEQALFCGHMAQFLKHRLSLLDALMTYGTLSKKHRLKMTLIHQQLTQGISLGDALGHVHFLDPLMISSIRIAEESGTLAGCFENLQRYTEQRYHTMEKVRKALYYPLLLSTFLLILFLFFLPSFILSIEGFLDQVHASEKRTASAFLSLIPSCAKALLFLGFLSLSVLALKYSPWRFYYDLLWAKLPFKNLLFSSIFFQTLALQIGSGVHLMTALRLQSDTMQNRYDKKCLQAMMQEMENGQPFSVAFQQYFKGEALLIHLLKLGEETGTMQESFEKSTHHLTHVLERQMAFFVGTLQPVSLIIIGGVLGWVAFSLFSPLYEALGGMAL